MTLISAARWCETYHRGRHRVVELLDRGLWRRQLHGCRVLSEPSYAEISVFKLQTEDDASTVRENLTRGAHYFAQQIPAGLTHPGMGGLSAARLPLVPDCASHRSLGSGISF